MEALTRVPYDITVKGILRLLEANALPDFVIRRLTRMLLASRLRLGYKPTAELQLSDLMAFVHSLKQMPIALSTETAKTQHYELPTDFFKLVLGKHLKYSSAYFTMETSTLDEAEEAMLDLYCERAKVKDGQTILDLGCGWGSLTLYIATKCPNSQVTGICNSTTQKAFIEEQCREQGLSNVVVFAADISNFNMEGTFDRILSIEMFEHMKNYQDLLKKISLWMDQESLLFIHHFCHKVFPYHFEDNVAVVDHWLANGKHYARTSEEWLRRMDKNIPSIYPILNDTYGKNDAHKWMAYWRTFFIAVAELFGYNDGEEWMISHFLFKKK